METYLQTNWVLWNYFVPNCMSKQEQDQKFCKAHTVPYAAKDAIDQELDRLESTGIIKSVPYSDWAAPFVAVPKKDGRMQICGDYKLTINPLLDIDQYSA